MSADFVIESTTLNNRQTIPSRFSRSFSVVYCTMNVSDALRISFYALQSSTNGPPSIPNTWALASFTNHFTGLRSKTLPPSNLIDHILIN